MRVYLTQFKAGFRSWKTAQERLEQARIDGLGYLMSKRTPKTLPPTTALLSYSALDEATNPKTKTLRLTLILTSGEGYGDGEAEEGEGGRS